MSTDTKAVEDILASSHALLTVNDLRRVTGLDDPTVRAQLKALAQQGQIEHIPGRGRYDGKYGLLRTTPQAAVKESLTVQEPAAAGTRELTPEAQAERDDFESKYGRDGNCACHLGAPCWSCTHPGNPGNQDEDESCWIVAGGGSEGGEAAVRAIPAPEYDPKSVSFKGESFSDRAVEAAVNQYNARAHLEAQFNGFDVSKLPRVLISCVAKLWPGSQGMFWEQFIERMPDRVAELRERVTHEQGVGLNACKDLARIGERLGTDPDEGGAGPILDAIDGLRADLANAKALADKLEHLLSSERTACAALREQLDHMTHSEERAGLDASMIDSFAVIAPKRPMRRFTAHDSAVKSAMAAASNGSKRGEVFALVHVGSAKRGAVWRPAK